MTVPYHRPESDRLPRHHPAENDSPPVPGQFGPRGATPVAPGPVGHGAHDGEHAPSSNHSPGLMAPGWHPDPAGRYRFRYWDGTRWTDHASNGDHPTTDPLHIAGQPAQPPQEQPTSQVGCLTVLLAVLAGLATAAVIGGGAYLVLSATGHGGDPPWWLRGVVIGAAVAVMLPILRRSPRKPGSRT